MNQKPVKLTTFYALRMDVNHGKMIHVKQRGEEVEIVPWLDTFIAPEPDQDPESKIIWYHVVEGESGLGITRNTMKEKAIADAKEKFQVWGEKRTKAMVRGMISLHGLSPIYRDEEEE